MKLQIKKKEAEPVEPVLQFELVKGGGNPNVELVVTLPNGQEYSIGFFSENKGTAHLVMYHLSTIEKAELADYFLMKGPSVEVD